jgi:thioesterase domain-containing protein
VALDRPLPEAVREIYFLEIAGRAEYAYEPSPYSGPLLLFHGEGLYDDPDLGWTGLVGSIEAVAVPGDHRNNRDLMAEPSVALVADRLRDALAAVREDALEAPLPVV